MTTATGIPDVPMVTGYGPDLAGAKALTTQTVIDFETRLALASAGMDAILAHKHGDTLDEARAAVQEVIEAPELLTEPEPRFKPHPILKAAGDLIRIRGWAQDTFEDGEGRLCAVGAIRTVVYGDGWADGHCDDPQEDAAATELLNRIASETGHMNSSIPMWNDSRASAADVLKLLY